VATLRFLLVLVLAGSGGPVGADVYRCVEAGQVEYTDRPCATATLVAMDGSPRALGVASVRGASVQTVSDATGEVANVAPLAGTSPRFVFETLGRPRAMDVRLEGITPTERWRYGNGDAALTVTFQHGRVVAVTTY
jgi:hypothetical protein